MILNPFILLIVLLGTIIIGGASIANVRSVWQRLLLVGMISGLCLYSGIGAAYPDVPGYYLFYYFGFLAAFACAFWFFRFAFVHLRISSERALAYPLRNIDHHPVWLIIIGAYLLMHVVLLVYPEMRINRLVTLPAPDLLASFAALWETQQIDSALKIIEYAQFLLTPFFYIALFRFRLQLIRLAVLIMLPLYLQYIAGGYIGRSTIFIGLGTVLVALWVSRPKHRRITLIVAVMAVTIFLVFSYYYGIIRISGSPYNIINAQALVAMIENETRFPLYGIWLIESGARVNQADYIRWILTLPIPKILTGEIKGARINYEISEIIFRLSRGEKGWYVALPGLVSESVYIYGRHFYWLHAVFIAFLATIVLRLVENTPELLFLKAYIVMTFAYHLNRGGISGPLGILINHFMLFYLFVFVHVLRLIRHSQPEIAFLKAIRASNIKRKN